MPPPTRRIRDTSSETRPGATWLLAVIKATSARFVLHNKKTKRLLASPLVACGSFFWIEACPAPGDPIWESAKGERYVNNDE